MVCVVARCGTQVEIRECKKESKQGLGNINKTFRRRKMKNTVKVAALAIVLMFGANIVKADGIIVGDRAEKGCVKQTSEGIIVGDRGIFGTIFDTLEGIIVGDSKENPCVEKNGIIVGDRTEGIIVGDRAEGIIVGD